MHNDTRDTASSDASSSTVILTSSSPLIAASDLLRIFYTLHLIRIPKPPLLNSIRNLRLRTPRIRTSQPHQTLHYRTRPVSFNVPLPPGTNDPRFAISGHPRPFFPPPSTWYLHGRMWKLLSRPSSTSSGKEGNDDCIYSLIMDCVCSSRWRSRLMRRSIEGR